ncbi:methyltransferase FkbM family protein [Nostoc carneum NIES-2107]|nr:methyltransferase FkbM family protein [Nostoc carneum NIES-2107]
MNNNVVTSVVRDFTPPVLTKALNKLRGSGKDKKTNSGILSNNDLAHELERLSKLPRRVPTKTSIFGHELLTVDAPSVLQVYDYYFQKRSCEFVTSLKKPRIIDCGANVGATVLYWKSLYPDSEIIAFEPDPEIFKLLSINCKDLSSITLIQAGLWTFDGELEFLANGADGGHIAEFADEVTEEKVKVTIPVKRLREYLSEPCSMLKIDIEGAETDVLQDCADLLHNVENIFVEHHSFIEQPQRLSAFFAVLENAGFRIHIQGEMPAVQPFIHRPVYNAKDMRLDVFGFRN